MLDVRPEYIPHCLQKIAREAGAHLADDIGRGTCTELGGTLRRCVH